VVWNRVTYITVNNISYKYVNICSEKKTKKQTETTKLLQEIAL